MYHAKVNLDFMEENVTQIKGGIRINVDVSVKDVMYVKKIIFGILLHVVVKTENILQVLWMIQRLFLMKLLTHARTRGQTTKIKIFSGKF